MGLGHFKKREHGGYWVSTEFETLAKKVKKRKRKNMNFKEYFNKYITPKCFEKRGERIRNRFEKTLMVMKMGIEKGWFDPDSPKYDKLFMRDVVYRLVVGYNGTSWGAGIISDAYTKSWKKEKWKNQNDIEHVFLWKHFWCQMGQMARNGHEMKRNLNPILN